jgi:dynein assembly factor with WDR repeat domains 1
VVTGADGGGCGVAELIEKLEVNDSNDFYLFKILRAHILPLTNCAFNKSGDK